MFTAQALFNAHNLFCWFAGYPPPGYPQQGYPQYPQGAYPQGPPPPVYFNQAPQQPVYAQQQSGPSKGCLEAW